MAELPSHGGAFISDDAAHDHLTDDKSLGTAPLPTGGSTPESSPSQSSEEHSPFSAAVKEQPSSETSPPGSPPLPSDETLAAHLQLVSTTSSPCDASQELMTSPLFTNAVRTHESHKKPGGMFSQWGFIGADVYGLSTMEGRGYDAAQDPRIFCNIAAPLSIFICGSQGSGKSHTLSVFLENYLAQSITNHLPRPLTGIVFFYDSLTSDFSGSPCEASYLSSNPAISVRVLCSRTNITNIKRIYSKLPNVKVEALRINESDLNTERMNVLMGVSKLQGGGGTVPLYMAVIERILRELREEQQVTGLPFDYRAFKTRVSQAALTDAQLAPLQQRLETLESFMVERQAKALDIFAKSNKKKKGYQTKEQKVKKGPKVGNGWAPKPGQLTIVDLSCPCITAEMACALFHICLTLFLEQETSVGRFAALDEAHQFMTDSGECRSLTDGLLKTIRLQRHLGARVIVSTQEPTISSALMDLCSITIVHRFSSPAWHQALVKHLAGASMAVDAGASEDEPDSHDKDSGGVKPLAFSNSRKMFEDVVNLATGEAFLFAPSAIVGLKETEDSIQKAPVRLGRSVLKLRIRIRVTQDGGQSVMAL